ncbi:hypothetical protein [Streptomyces phytohabitans]|uniref:hypothetical protein n=1 Tax=Streptomyces phytohabitans TaxID=1150371 RepID=UPI00345C590F
MTARSKTRTATRKRWRARRRATAETGPAHADEPGTVAAVAPEPATGEHPTAEAGTETEADGKRSAPAERPVEQVGSAVLAFDALYTRHARALTRQAYLLCAHRRIAEHAVAHAFHLAWERWPEVAADRDPAGWVRAAVYEYALSPWHQLHPGCRATPAHPGPPADRAMLDGLLRLPRTYRRALLLHDGLGLDVEATAAETEAGAAATSRRVGHAREALGASVPELREADEDRRPSLVRERLRLLAAAQPVRTPPPAVVRRCSERTTRRRTRAAVGLTLLVTAATAVSWVVSEGRVDASPARHAPATPGLPGTERTATEAYVPELRSRNHRMRLGEHGPERATEDPAADDGAEDEGAQDEGAQDEGAQEEGE